MRSSVDATASEQLGCAAMNTNYSQNENHSRLEIGGSPPAEVENNLATIPPTREVKVLDILYYSKIINLRDSIIFRIHKILTTGRFP